LALATTAVAEFTSRCVRFWLFFWVVFGCFLGSRPVLTELLGSGGFDPHARRVLRVGNAVLGADWCLQSDGPSTTIHTSSGSNELRLRRNLLLASKKAKRAAATAAVRGFLARFLPFSAVFCPISTVLC